MEKNISFSLGNLRFIDSCQFLNASLEGLVNNLAADSKDKCTHLCSEKLHHQDLLIRKGVYPYDYVDGLAKLLEPQLPSKSYFYSILKEEDITEEDYNHARDVWNTFNCQTMGGYHDLYLQCDVLLLADVFKIFRKVCLDKYALDPAHYYTSPGLSWDAMLKHTKVKLDLLTDIDMILMVEQGMRGGISMISNKYAKANNPYVEDYDATKSKSYITYLDANNLYGSMDGTFMDKNSPSNSTNSTNITNSTNSTNSTTNSTNMKVIL